VATLASSRPRRLAERALLAEAVSGKQSAFRAVALGAQVPRTLQGKLPAIAINNLADFFCRRQRAADLVDQQRLPGDVRPEFRHDAAWHRAGDLRGGEDAEVCRPGALSAGGRVVYPNTPFGNSLKQVAQLMKAGPWRRGGFSDIGGWTRIRTREM